MDHLSGHTAWHTVARSGKVEAQLGYDDRGVAHATAASQTKRRNRDPLSPSALRAARCIRIGCERRLRSGLERSRLHSRIRTAFAIGGSSAGYSLRRLRRAPLFCRRKELRVTETWPIICVEPVFDTFDATCSVVVVQPASVNALPARRKASISSAVYPNSASTSRVCSPLAGDGCRAPKNSPS